MFIEFTLPVTLAGERVADIDLGVEDGTYYVRTKVERLGRKFSVDIPLDPVADADFIKRCDDYFATKEGVEYMAGQVRDYEREIA